MGWRWTIIAKSNRTNMDCAIGPFDTWDEAQTFADQQRWDNVTWRVIPLYDPSKYHPPAK